MVIGFDQNETKQLFLSFGEGTVGLEDLSAPDPHGGRRPNGLEGMSKDEVTARPEHVVVGQGILREASTSARVMGLGFCITGKLSSVPYTRHKYRITPSKDVDRTSALT